MTKDVWSKNKLIVFGILILVVSIVSVVPIFMIESTLDKLFATISWAIIFFIGVGITIFCYESVRYMRYYDVNCLMEKPKKIELR